MPESKLASMQWKGKEEPMPLKFKCVSSAGKVMVSVFWDNKETLLMEYFPDRKQRVNSQTYFDNLMKSRKVIKDKRPGMLSHKVWLFHDNATPHTAHLVQKLLRNFGWNVFTHLPYSLKLALSDFHLFLVLKKWLGNRRF